MLKPETIYRSIVVSSLLVAGLVSGAQASEPGWSPVIIARGDYREQIKSVPMEMRPYRPLHFYGNTVRRRHYRGSAVPRFEDVVSPVVVSGRRLVQP